MLHHLLRAGLCLAIAATMSTPGLVAQSRGVFEARDEGRLWEPMPPFGRALSRCLDADGDGHAERFDYSAPAACPANAPLADDELYWPIGIAVHDPGTSDPARLSKYRVYVADWANHRVAVFDFRGRALPPIGAGGMGVSDRGEILPPYSEGSEYPEGRLLFPEGVSTDAAGNVLVADTYNGRIQVFNAEGAFQFGVKLPIATRSRIHRAWPSQVAVLPGTTVRSPASNCSTLGSGRVAIAATAPSHPLAPYDGIGQVLVYDEKFCPAGTLGEAASATLEAGSFGWPSGVTFDSSGRLIVADSIGHRVDIFAADAARSSSRPMPVVSVTEGLRHPVSTTVDRRGRVVIADSNNHRLAAYAPDYSRRTARFLFEARTEQPSMTYPQAIAQDAGGRYFVSNLDGVRVFEVPALAVFHPTASVASARPGRVFDVRFSIVVPAGKSSVSGVEPTIAAAGPVDRISGPTVVVGQAPPLNLQASEVVTYSYRYRVTSASASTATFTVSARGNPRFATVAPAKIVSVRILCATCEDAGPAVTATLDPDAAVASGPVNVAFEASDRARGGSGVRTIVARFSGAEQSVRPRVVTFTNDTNADPFSATLTITQPGTTSVEYWAVDALGNESARQSTLVQIDLFGPDVRFTPRTPANGVSADGRQWWNRPVEVDVHATDDFTADENIRFLAGSRVLTFSPDGFDQAQLVRVADEAGNVSEFYSLQANRGGTAINIDSVPPVSRASEAAGVRTAPFSVTFDATDAMSGIREVRASTGNGPLAAVAGPLAIGAGRTTLRFQAVDVAGNVEAEQSLVFTVNSPPRAVPDILITRSDDDRAVDVLDNDSDPDGDALTLVSVAAGSHGTTSINSSITSRDVQYHPAAGYVGADRFTYVVRDSHGSTSTGTVLVVVLPASYRFGR